MLDVNQYILLFIKEKTEEINAFKYYIKTSTFPEREISQDEWKSIYLDWAIKQEIGVEKINKMPKIYLSED